MEHPQSESLITTYPIGGDNKVEKIGFDASDDDGLLRSFPQEDLFHGAQ
jgi:hypothetical protein